MLEFDYTNGLRRQVVEPELRPDRASFAEVACYR